MTYGPTQVYTAGIASGASTSSYIDLGGKSYRRLSVNAITMSTGAMISVYGSDSATGTYGPCYEKINSATSAYNSLTVGTATSGGWCQIDAPAMLYFQFVTSAVVSGGVSITVVASD